MLESSVVSEHMGRQMVARRQRLGMSRAALAQAAGLDAVQLERYESGTHQMPATVLWSLTAALKCDVGYFFEGLPAGN